MFQWDANNIKQIARHNVTPEQAEQTLRDPKQVPAGRSIVDEEEYEAIVGATADGTLVFVVYTVRGDRLRVATARKATRRERRLYTRR